MAWGLQDVVTQSRFIDESDAEDTHKRSAHGKLDALLGLVEAASCRRVVLLDYFGEASQPCGNCDNCLEPPVLWDATEAARKALSAVYRTGQRFGAGHVIDVLLGKSTDKARQWEHDALSVFGIGTELDGKPADDKRWRAVIRALVARGWLNVDHDAFGALKLTEAARPVLKGEVPVMLRQPIPKKQKATKSSTLTQDMDIYEADLFDRLREWRRQTANEHDVPAYVIFHDSTLREIALQKPMNLTEMGEISGIGARKLEAYGTGLLAVVQGSVQ
jgi:ATP-dependent DNA helicase RecQ